MRTAKHSRKGANTAAMGCFLQFGNANLPSLYVRHSTADKAPSRASTDFCITASKSQPQDQRCIYSNSADACRLSTAQLQDRKLCVKYRICIREKALKVLVAADDQNIGDVQADLILSGILDALQDPKILKGTNSQTLHQPSQAPS